MIGPRSRILQTSLECAAMLASVLGLAAGSVMAWKILGHTSRAVAGPQGRPEEPTIAFRPIAPRVRPLPRPVAPVPAERLPATAPESSPRRRPRVAAPVPPQR